MIIFASIVFFFQFKASLDGFLNWLFATLRIVAAFHALFYCMYVCSICTSVQLNLNYCWLFLLNCTVWEVKLHSYLSNNSTNKKITLLTFLIFIIIAVSFFRIKINTYYGLDWKIHSVDISTLILVVAYEHVSPK